jgi:hypothetical protein
MIRAHLTYIATCLASLLLGGCFKVTTNTTVVVKPLVQQESGGETVAAEGVDVYAYYTTDEGWDIASYEDAVNRIITNKASGEQRTTPDIFGEPYAIEGSENCYTAMLQTSSPAMVVVVYPEAKMYGYMFHYLDAENLPNTFLTLIFRPWQTAPYTEGQSERRRWHIFPPVTVSGEDNTTDDNTSEDAEGTAQDNI